MTHLRSFSQKRFSVQHSRISINLSNLLNLHMIVPWLARQQYLHMEIDLCVFIFRILDISANHAQISFFFFFIVFCVMNCIISVHSADFGALLEKFNKFTKIRTRERIRLALVTSSISRSTPRRMVSSILQSLLLVLFFCLVNMNGSFDSSKLKHKTCNEAKWNVREVWREKWQCWHVYT